jgi:hypothetical protein
MVYYKRSMSKHKEPKEPKYFTTSSMLNTVKEGIAFGIGSSVAHNTISRLFNSYDCSGILEEYKQCLNNNKNDCEKLLTEYEKCK